MKVFDSSVLIAHLRGDPRAKAALLEAVPDGACTSVVCRTEVEGGMRTHERSEVARLFHGLEVLPVTDAVARLAGRRLREFRSSHQGIDVADYLIGATTEHHRAELVTLNVKHFPMFEGLRPPWGPDDPGRSPTP